MIVARAARVEPIEFTDGTWGWHAVAANSQVVFTAGESFARKGNAIRAMKRSVEIMRDPALVIDTGDGA